MQSSTEKAFLSFVPDHFTAKNWNIYSHALRQHFDFPPSRRYDLIDHGSTLGLFHDRWDSLHMTFFEILPEEKLQHLGKPSRGAWEYGPLYQGSGQLLCESAFSVCVLHPEKTMLLMS